MLIFRCRLRSADQLFMWFILLSCHFPPDTSLFKQIPRHPPTSPHCPIHRGTSTRRVWLPASSVRLAKKIASHCSALLVGRKSNARKKVYFRRFKRDRTRNKGSIKTEDSWMQSNRNLRRTKNTLFSMELKSTSPIFMKNDLRLKIHHEVIWPDRRQFDKTGNYK